MPETQPLARRPTARQALATFVGGVLLAATTCAGFWLNFNPRGDDTASTVFFVLFLGSLLVIFVGVVLLGITEGRAAAARRRAQVASGLVPATGALKALGIAIGLSLLAAGTCGGMMAVGGGDLPVIILLVLSGLAAVGAVLYFVFALVRALAGR